jgi:hypothetical protein
MAITTTTLSAAITDSALQFKVAAATGFTVGYTVLVDQEYLGKITEVSGLVVKVSGRGTEGTAAVAHHPTAPVSAGPTSEFPGVPLGEVAPIPPDAEGFITYGATPTAIAVPSKDSFIILNSDTTTAYTLVDPTPGSAGRRLTIMAGTADAYTVTNTTGYNGAGTTGDVATFGGAKGDNMVIRASATQWLIEDLRNVTVG